MALLFASVIFFVYLCTIDACFGITKSSKFYCPKQDAMNVLVDMYYPFAPFTGREGCIYRAWTLLFILAEGFC